MKLLIVGLGYVGLPLAGGLARRGHEVHALRRTAVDALGFLRLHRGDATDPATYRHLDTDFDQVLVLLSAGERSEAAYERTYVAGATSIRHAFPTARIVWVSSTAVYDAEGDASIDDSTTPSAASGTAALLLRAEAATASGPHLIVRPSGIYGPERTTLLRRLARGDITPAERATWTNRIHRDDLVRALAFCVDRPDLSGTLLASDQEPAQLGAMQDWVQTQRADRALPSSLQEKGGVPPLAPAAATSRAPTEPSIIASSGATAEPSIIAPSGATAEPPATASSAPRDGSRADARKSRRIIASRLAARGFTWRYPSFREGYGEILRASE